MNNYHCLTSTLAIALSLCACGEDSETPKKEISRVEIPDNSFKPVALEDTIGNLVEELQNAEAQDVQVGVVLKTLTGYWAPVKIGAGRAIGELAVPGVVVAPTEATEVERTARQLVIVQEQRTNGYKGLGVAPMAGTLTSEIDASTQAGMPVVTIDSDLADSGRQLYIGTINEEAGKTAAKTLIDLQTTHSGRVLLLGHDQADDWPDGYQRTMGAKTALEAAGYTVDVRRTTWTDTGVAEDVAFSKTWLANNPDRTAMIGLFSAAFRCAMAADESGLTGDDITILAFDFEPQTVEYMRSGLIKATHAQRQYYMGYLAPYALYAANVLGIERTKQILAPHMLDEFRFNAGLDVVQSNKLDEYNDFLDSLGISGS